MDAEIVLTMEEAKDAMCMDLAHYGIQEDTLEEIADLAGGGWPDLFRGVLSGDDPPVDAVIALVQELINSPTVTEEVLCGALSLMFWSDVRRIDDPNGEALVGVATELDGFVCQHCGRCCTHLDYSRSLTPEDITLWKQAGRHDILARVGRDPDDGGSIIWVHPETGECELPCPFLSSRNGQNRCAIHDLKPATCREYPATKKHGFMTGCAGVELMVANECAALK